MTKNILSAGFSFPGRLADFIPLSSRRSLLDAELIIFRPGIGPFYDLDWQTSHYQGKPLLNETASFQLKESANYWRQQLRLALQAGINIFVFMPAPEIVCVDTGQRTYSGTGRNRQTTRHVETFSTSAMLPAFADITATEGTAMQLTEAGKLLSQYWSQWQQVHLQGGVSQSEGNLSNYCIGRPRFGCCLFSITGTKGKVIVLPALTDYDDDAIAISEARRWSSTDKAFGHRLLKALVDLDGNIRAEGAKTPVPEWASQDEFSFQQERNLRQAILTIDENIESQLKEKALLERSLASEGELRHLLCEQGHALESAILNALGTLGFSCDRFRDSDSEFDAIFSSAEGRFLGEAEGKESKAISVEKLRQLEMNIQEDFAREEVAEFAHGVLFGNAYRLQSPNERPEQWFTDKCVKAAGRSGTGLIRTLDLFFAAKYVKETNDQGFAAQCRKAIFSQLGSTVRFPQTPVDETGTIRDTSIGRAAKAD